LILARKPHRCFFRKSRSIRSFRFSSSSSFIWTRSSIVSGLSLMLPLLFAAFTQLPRVPSFRPRSRAISATGRPELTTSSTASALYSGAYFFRFEAIVHFPLDTAMNYFQCPRKQGFFKFPNRVDPLCRKGSDGVAEQARDQ
jgi:hypothetical protein